jgi:membrane-bound lytic murein transglycosylase MltF
MGIASDRWRRAGARTLACAALLAWACRTSPPPPEPTTDPSSVSPAKPLAADDAPEPAPEATPFPAGLAPVVEPFKGDLDGMVERRMIRVLTVQNPILYSVDRGRETGITYDAIKAFETEINKKLGKKVVKVHLVPIAVGRDQLIPDLLAGRGDIAAGMLTVTPERRKKVAFSEPFATGVREVLVTGPAAPPVASLEELSGREIYVRPSSSYAEHLRALNRRFSSEGKAPVVITPAPETLEDGDILEMVAAGLVPATVVDDVMADLYTQVFPALRKNSDIASPPGEIAWAFRKGSPKLAAALKAFVRTHRQGTLAGNVAINKYLKSVEWVKNAEADEDRRRFESMMGLFKKYGDEYDLDYLLMAAQGYQESGLDQSKRSRVGAIGVMQVMPSTARDKAIAIPNIEQLENNIHAGVKYVRWVVDNFYDDPKISRLNKGLFAFASYNAGPAKVARLRREAKAQGLDPNRWFNNVELIAAKRIGRETVNYVSNIYKYYLAYQLLLRRSEDARAATARVGADGR